MIDLAVRSREEERMDAVDLPAETLAAVLGDLAQVNAVTLAARPTIAFVDRASRRQRHLKILDVGFGDGDMLRRIARRARKLGRSVELVGIDLNPNSASAARRHTPREDAIDFRTGDYAGLAGQGWDLVISSLVAHHMTDDQLLAFLRFMEAEAKVGWLVNDLHRHRVAHLGYPLLARAFGWHPIVRADGRLSIARAFRPLEWHAILTEAGIPDAHVFRAFPFRLCVERLR